MYLWLVLNLWPCLGLMNAHVPPCSASFLSSFIANKQCGSLISGSLGRFHHIHTSFSTFFHSEGRIKICSRNLSYQSQTKFSLQTLMYLEESHNLHCQSPHSRIQHPPTVTSLATYTSYSFIWSLQPNLHPWVSLKYFLRPSFQKMPFPISLSCLPHICFSLSGQSIHLSQPFSKCQQEFKTLWQTPFTCYNHFFYIRMS